MDTSLSDAKLLPTDIEQEVEAPTERIERVQAAIDDIPIEASLSEAQVENLEAERARVNDRIDTRLAEATSVGAAEYRFVKARYILFVDSVQRAVSSTDET